MAKTERETIQSAISRAQGRTVLVRYAGSANGTARYVVDSATDVDVAYRITCNGAALSCECPAAGRGLICWHCAAVAQVRVGRQGFGLPADGPSAEQLRQQAESRSRIEEIAAVFAA